MYYGTFHVFVGVTAYTNCVTTDNIPSGCSCNCEKNNDKILYLFLYFFFKMMYFGSRRRRQCHDVYSTPVIVCLVSARGVMVIKGISNWDRFVDSKLVDTLLSGDAVGWNLLEWHNRNGKRRNHPVWSACASVLSGRCKLDSKSRYDV
jgi:hypothetical protein